MIKQLYSSLHVNGDDNVAHYGNDDVNYGDNDDNDNGAEAQKPTIRTIPDSLKLLGNHLENPDCHLPLQEGDYFDNNLAFSDRKIAIGQGFR